MQTETTIRIRYCETDRMGIVHHSNYPKYLEMGRTEYLRALGKPYPLIEKEGILFPLAHMEMSFLSSVTYDDEIIVHTSLASFKGAVFKVSYVITCGERLVLKGITTHAITDTQLHPIILHHRDPELSRLFAEQVKEALNE